MLLKQEIFCLVNHDLYQTIQRFAGCEVAELLIWRLNRIVIPNKTSRTFFANSDLPGMIHIFFTLFLSYLRMKKNVFSGPEKLSAK